MLVLKDINKKKGTRLILNRVSLSLEAGQCAALVGPNGAGKTSLLRIVATLMKPDSGELTVRGLGTRDPGNLLKIREMLGFVGHESMLYSQLTVEENLLFSGRMYFLTEDYLKEKIDTLLEQLKILHRKHDLVGSLSRGMKQKVSLVRALLHEPKLLLLDEPTTGLDKGSLTVFQELLAQEKAKGKTILLVSHKPELLLELFDLVVHMKNGSIVSIETS